MRTFYDAVTVADIPADAAMVAGYVDGLYANVAQLRERFPRALVLTIAVDPANDADILDVERGDAQPMEAPGWAVRQRQRGATPTVYCSQANWPAVQAAFSVLRVPQPLYGIANYDGVPVIPAGAIYKQYNTDVLGGYDVNVCADYWPGIDPPPKGDTMLLIYARPGIYYAPLDCSWKVLFADPADVIAWASAQKEAGVKVIQVDLSNETVKNIPTLH